MPPGLTSPSMMFTSGTAPPMGVKLSCIELTDPVDVPVVDAANRPDAAGPKRVSLPSMFPPDWLAVTAASAPRAVSLGLPPVSNTMATSRRRQPQAEHGRQHHVALAPVLGQDPVHPGEGEGEGEEHPDLGHVGDRVGVLERVRRVGVVGAAAVLADLLDRLLAGDGPAGDRLLAALDGGDRPGAVEVLDHALADQEQRADEGEGEQDPGAHAHQVDPEVADGVRPPADEAPDEGEDHGRRRRRPTRSCGRRGPPSG